MFPLLLGRGTNLTDVIGSERLLSMLVDGGRRTIHATKQRFSSSAAYHPTTRELTMATSRNANISQK
jgi:hypothetical protein